MRDKVSFIAFVKNHQDSSGSLAEWTIKDHSTGKILASFPSKEEAKEHLKQMHIHKDKKSEAAPEGFKWFKNIDELLRRNCTGGV